MTVTNKTNTLLTFANFMQVQIYICCPLKVFCSVDSLAWPGFDAHLNQDPFWKASREEPVKDDRTQGTPILPAGYKQGFIYSLSLIYLTQRRLSVYYEGSSVSDLTQGCKLHSAMRVCE
jgi:hypothetical protein